MRFKLGAGNLATGVTVDITGNTVVIGGADQGGKTPTLEEILRRMVEEPEGRGREGGYWWVETHPVPNRYRHITTSALSW